MLQTFDRTNWKEDPAAERERDTLNGETPPEILRRLYPFKARALKKCHAYGIEEGQLLEYARARMVPQFYPIEAVINTGNPKISPRKACMDSLEVVLLEV